MNGQNTYKQRQSVSNVGEERFENWCNLRGYKWYRLGFDEKNNNVDLFYLLNEYIRNLPDYFIVKDGKAALVNVKGTCNIKREEVEKIQCRIQSYSSRQVDLLYAFCFEDGVKIIKANSVIEKYYEAKFDKQWDDGKVYRSLEIT